MTRISLLLNLLLGIQLTVGLMTPAFAQQSCPSGLVFDNALNRCLTSAQTAQIMNATASCPPGDMKCYRDNAESALKGKVEKGEVKEQLKNKGSMAVNAAAVAMPLLMVATGIKSTSKCAAPSHIAMVAGGTALFVGDFLSTKLHKSRLKAIEKEWQKIIKPDAAKEKNGDNKRVNATEAQSQAFEMLAKSEDSMEKAAKMKAMFFAASMGAFSASAVLATLEFLHPGGICESKEKMNQKKADDEFKEITKERGYQAGNSDHSLAIQKATKANQALIDSRNYAKTLMGMLKSAPTRAALSGILAGWSYTMYSHAKKQAEISKDRAILLRKMRDEFNQATGAINSCTSDERNNPGSPNCYCYTSEGQRNTSRTGSQVCAKLFTGRNLLAKSAISSKENGAPKGCISSGGSFDEKCACKVTKTCLKATPNNLQGFNPGSFSMLANGLSPVDSLGNNTAGSGNVSDSAAVNSALRLLDAQKKLEDKKELAKFKAGKEKLKNKIEGSLMASGSGTSPNFLGSNSSPLPSSPIQAASLLEKEIKDESSSVSKINGNGDGLSIPSGSSKDENLEFGMTADQLADQETQIAQVMQENLDYGGNDINNGSSTNIFELVSSRYQRSGMRRLFDENGKVPAEPAAKTDISDK